MPIAQVFPVSGALSLATYAIQRALHPLYGSVPTRRHLLKVIAGSTAVAGLSPGLSLDNALYLAPFVLAAAPQIVYRVGCYTTDWKDAEQGAPATLAAALIPIFYSGISVAKRVAVSCASSIYSDPNSSFGRRRTSQMVLQSLSSSSRLQ